MHTLTCKCTSRGAGREHVLVLVGGPAWPRSWPHGSSRVGGHVQRGQGDEPPAPGWEPALCSPVRFRKHRAGHWARRRANTCPPSPVMTRRLSFESSQLEKRFLVTLEELTLPAFWEWQRPGSRVLAPRFSRALTPAGRRWSCMARPLSSPTPLLQVGCRRGAPSPETAPVAWDAAGGGESAIGPEGASHCPARAGLGVSIWGSSLGAWSGHRLPVCEVHVTSEVPRFWTLESHVCRFTNET